MSEPTVVELALREESRAAKRAGVRQSDMQCWGEPARDGTKTCGKPAHSDGLCKKHNTAWRRAGTTYPTVKQIRWAPVIARAAEIVHMYRRVHGIKVTLRQLFYRLVSEEMIINKQSHYNYLSTKTAAGRREGTFPELLEHGRRIEQYNTWEGPAGLIRWAQLVYRVDRTRSQPCTVVVAVEKNALKGLLVDWFGNRGIPVLPLGGYGSETLERKIRDLVAKYDRPAVLIYAGDFDASGMNIGETFIENTEECWDEVTRIGLSENQIASLGLPALEGKKDDPRAPGFKVNYPEIHEQAWESGAVREGWPVQVELDAVEPTMLKSWFEDEVGKWWDPEAYERDMKRERRDDNAIDAVVSLVPIAERLARYDEYDQEDILERIGELFDEYAEEQDENEEEDED